MWARLSPRPSPQFKIRLANKLPTVVPGYPADPLTATTRAPAAHTPVATPIPGHDRAADMATGCVAQVDKLFERVGGVIEATINERGPFGRWLLAIGQTALRRRRLHRVNGRRGRLQSAALAEC